MHREQNKNRDNMMKPQTNTFSKYCKDKTQKKIDVKYAHIIQHPYNKQ
jgi:hypothetical protein